LDGVAPERIETAGYNAHAPNVSRLRDRLAFTRSLDNVDLYGLEPGRPSQPWFASSLGEDSAHESAVCVLDERTGRDRPYGELKDLMCDPSGLAVSPDERVLLLRRRPPVNCVHAFSLGVLRKSHSTCTTFHVMRVRFKHRLSPSRRSEPLPNECAARSAPSTTHNSGNGFTRTPKIKPSATEGGRLIPWPTEPMFLLDRQT
jgi:hypothetical protein